MCLRSTVGRDPNFVWCRGQGCNSGQLHEGGSNQPIVRCLECGIRSCFVHSVEWHERLTCAEYDEMSKNPEGFKSAMDREEEASRELKRRQLEGDERLAQQLDDEEKLAEQQRQRHEEQLRRARVEQEAEGDRRRREEENRVAEQRRQREKREEENRQAKASRDAEDARRKQEQERQKTIQDIKRRQKEDQLSMAKVQSTTKQCPGCQWPIEKNDGCDHMTCKFLRYFFEFSCKLWYSDCHVSV